jgi:hypothetical protein
MRIRGRVTRDIQPGTSAAAADGCEGGSSMPAAFAGESGHLSRLFHTGGCGHGLSAAEEAEPGRVP